MKLVSSVISFLVLIQCVEWGSTARILGLFTTPSKSHLIIHMAVVKSLVERGHDVTVVTTLPLDSKNQKYRHVYLNDVPALPKEKHEAAMKPASGPIAAMSRLKMVNNIMAKLHNDALQDPKMVELMANESFDLVILGYFFNDFQLGVAAHFKCPVVISWMISPIKLLANFVGQPMEPLYVPNLFAGTHQPLGFIDRVKNVIFSAVDTYLLYSFQATLDNYYNANFPSDKYPTLDEMKKNVSLLLVNHHFSEGPILPTVPAVIQIGGIQVKDKPDRLPTEIKKFLDDAKDGAIFFSLGSNIQSAEMKPETIEIIYNALSGIKQRVLWKWETDNTPGNSSNILFKKWLPQDDILAHSNLKLFISHGGKGSVAEAQYHAVPIIGIPMFGDQITNSKAVEESGFGIHLQFQTINESILTNSINEILENPKYQLNLNKFSSLYRDRPMSAKETAAYWIEYVIRHRGAKHMQSPAVHMTTIQYYGLDMIAIAVVLWHFFMKLVRKIILKVVKKIYSKVMQLVRKKNTDKKKKTK